MKNKNLLLNFVVLLGLVAAVVGLFLNFWTSDLAVISGSYGLFPDFSILDDATLATVSQVLLLVGLGLVAVYAVLYILEYLRIAKKTAKLRMFVAACAILVVIVAAVLGFVFSGNHTETIELLGNKSVLGIKLAVGFYLTAIGTAVAGVFGALASRK